MEGSTMAKKVLKGIRPTRIELLKLRKREVLAQKGHDLLEEKRDAMLMEFFRMAEELSEQRRKLDQITAQAFENLAKAQMMAGLGGVNDVSGAVPDVGKFTMNVRHIMGVAVPVIASPPDLRHSIGRGYGYAGTCAALDEAADSFTQVLVQTLKVAETENTLQKVAQEIEKTKRRVNALEKVLIPELRATQRHIESHLEELEREDLFRRKRMKLLMRKNSG
jgi:V/A-type H+-transporting ATPase subunit D